VPDEEKIGALNAALEDARFQTVRTTVETLALQTGTAIDYPSYLQSLITHAESLKTSNRQTNSVQTQRQQHTGNKKDDWKKDMLAYVPFKEFQKLSAEEKAKRQKAKEEAKKTQSRSSNASEFQPMVQVPAVVHVDAAQSTPIPSEAATMVSEATPWTQQQPSIRDIMSSQMRLPPGDYNDSQGRRYHINTIRVIRLTHMELESHQDLCLIDGGSNNGLAGANMRLFEQAEQPELVDIVGPSNQVEPALRSLPVGTYCAVVTTALGTRVLGLFPNYIGYGKGKSILSKSQSEAHGVLIYDKARKYGGQQKLVTPDEYVFKFK
jgi:hypothetical protein